MASLPLLAVDHDSLAGTEQPDDIVARNGPAAMGEVDHHSLRSLDGERAIVIVLDIFMRTRYSAI